MDVDDALTWWESLQSACPHGCRIHLTGGEPFGDWTRLAEIARRAHDQNLGPLEMVETNAYWATDDAVCRDRLRVLDAAGMERIKISADPYHQQYVEIDRPRRLARVAAEVLGGDRVQVRWRDWLAEGTDTHGLDAAQWADLLERWGGRDRLNGRAVKQLSRGTARQSRKSPSDLADTSCRESLLRSKHVHVDPAGLVVPGVCAGIILGRLDARGGTVAELWQHLYEEYKRRPVLAALVQAGPVGLLDWAREVGYRQEDAYASKCELCWKLRSALVDAGRFPEELGPPERYGLAGDGADASAAPSQSTRMPICPVDAPQREL